MSTINQTRGKRNRDRSHRTQHADAMRTRNRERGFSTTDLRRVGGGVLNRSPEIDEKAKAISVAGTARPSYHTMRTRRRLARGIVWSPLYGFIDTRRFDPRDYKNGSRVEVVQGTTQQTSGPHPPVMHEDEIEMFDKNAFDSIGHDESSPTDRAPSCPSVEDWDDAVAEARSRKKGVKVIAKRRGWILSKDGDVKTRESWIA